MITQSHYGTVPSYELVSMILSIKLLSNGYVHPLGQCESVVNGFQ